MGSCDSPRSPPVAAAEGSAGVCNPFSPSDVMGYHDAREIPNYWKYAESFTLDDHMFESNASWSLPAHLFEVSEWSARCSGRGRSPPAASTMTTSAATRRSRSRCSAPSASRAAGKLRKLLRSRTATTQEVRARSLGALRGGLPGEPRRRQPAVNLDGSAVPRPGESTVSTSPRATRFHEISTGYNYAWTDITYLLHKDGVSWGYFITPGSQPDCDGGNANWCTPTPISVGTPDIWNPLPSFTDVRQDGQLGNIQDVTHFLADARAGTLPAVSWVVPDQAHSEHPPANIAAGQAYVTNLINTVMRGPRVGSSTAIFLVWTDWGGFYDHVPPPRVDRERVRDQGPVTGDQSLCAARIHRPSNVELRRHHQVHRGRLPGRPAARPADRRAPRSTTRRT